MATTEENNKFKKYLADKWISEDKATREDALAFQALSKPTQPAKVEKTGDVIDNKEVKKTTFKDNQTTLDKQIQQNREANIQAQTPIKATEVQTPEVKPEDKVITQDVTPEITPKQEIKPVEPVKTETKKETPIQDAQIVEENQKNLDATDKAVQDDNFNRLTLWQPNNQALARFIKEAKFQEEAKASVKAYLIQQNNQKKIMKASALSPEQLYREISKGNITEWWEVFNWLSETQRFEYNEYKKKQTTKNIVAPFKETTLDFNNILSWISEIFETNTKQKYNELMNSGQMSKLVQEREDKVLEIKALDQEIEDLYDEDKTDVFFKGLPKHLIEAKRSKLAEAQYNKKETLIAEYDSKTNEISSLKEDIDREMQFDILDSQNKKDAYMTALNLYQTERARMDSFAIAEFEANSKLLAEETEREFKRELLDREEQFARENKKGIYQTDRNWDLLYIVDWVAETVKNNDWTVVWITREEEYTDTVSTLDNWGFWILRTYKDWRVDYFTRGVDGTDSYNTNMWSQNVLATIPKWDYWCWEYTNIYVEKGELVSASTGESVRVWDSYESKKQFINNTEPQIWGLAVWNPNPEGKFWENGHIWVVTWYDEATWKIRIRDANSKWDKQVKEYEIDASQILNSDWGYIHLTKPWVTETETTQYSQEARDWADNISKWNASIQNVPNDIRTEVSSVLANIDISLDEDNPIIQWLKGQYEIANEIVDWDTDKDGFFEFDSDNETIVESISWEFRFWPFEIGKENLLSKIQFLLDEQPLNKLIDVKAQWWTFGALSNAELALLTKSSSILNSAAIRDEDTQELKWFRLSEADTKKHLRILRDSYKKAIERKTWIQQLDLETINQQLGSSWMWATDLSGTLDY